MSESSRLAAQGMTVQNDVCISPGTWGLLHRAKKPVLGPKGIDRLNSPHTTVANLGRVQGLGMWTVAKFLFSLNSFSYCCCQKPNAGLDGPRRGQLLCSPAARSAGETEPIPIHLQCPQSGLLCHPALVNVCLGTSKGSRLAQQYRPHHSADHIAPWDCPS